MRHMLDCAVLPAEIPPCDVLAGYISSPAASHVWSAEDWSRAKAHATYILPIHVAPGNSNATAGASAGHESVNEARGLNMPEGSSIALDIEANVAAHVVESGYAHAWCGVVASAGFKPLVYASASEKALVAPLGPLWLAHWGQPAKLIAGSVATQYANESPKGFDSSVVADSLDLARVGHVVTPAGPPSSAPMVGIVQHPTADGYWQFNEDGAVFAFGAAGYHGGANAPDVSAYVIVGMAATRTGNGYRLTASDGGVFCYGDASFHGAVVKGVLKTP